MRMNFFLRLIDRAFDFAFYLMRPFPPLLIIAVFAVLTSVCALLVFRHVSNQKAIRKAKNKLGAHVLAIRLFPDQLSVVARAYLAFLGSLVAYLRHILRPVLVLFIPFFFLFLQLDAYLAYAPLKTSQNFLVCAFFADGELLKGATLHLPEGLALTAPPVHIPADREVDWRLQATHSGTYEIQVATGNQEFSKRVVAGTGLKRINTERDRGGLWQALTSQDEPPLPKNGPVERIQIQYPQREIAMGRWEANWLVPFIAMMLIGALTLKGFLRTEL
jgi:hypothetical protein